MSRGAMLTEPAAIVQTAVDLAAAGAELDGLLDKIDHAEIALLDWRVEAGDLFRRVRKTIPPSGPRAKAWGEFVRARKVSLASAARYMKLAEYVAQHPEAKDKGVQAVYEEMGIHLSGWGREILVRADENLCPEQGTTAARPSALPPAIEPGTIEMRETPAAPPPAAAPGPVTRLVLDPTSPVGQMLVDKPLPPVRPVAPRTAEPAATTLVLDLAPPAAPTEEAPICGSAQIAGSATGDLLAQAEALAAEDEAAGRLTAAEEQALREGGSALDVDEDEVAAPPRRAAAKPEDPYEVGERVMLRELADEFDPRPPGHVLAEVGAWYDLLGADATLEKICEAREAETGELRSAARRGYEQGEAEALERVAGWLGLDLEAEPPAELAERVEQKIEDLRADVKEDLDDLEAMGNEMRRLRADAEEVRAARLKLQELGEQLTRAEAELERVRGDRDQVVLRWEEEGPRRARLTALLNPGADVALLDAAAAEIEALRKLAGDAADGAVPPQDALLDAARALGRQHAHERLRALNNGDRRKLLALLGEPDAEDTRAAAALLVYGRAFDEEKANPANVCDAKHPTGPARCGRAPHAVNLAHRGAAPHTAVEWMEPAPPLTGPAAAKAARAALAGQGPPVDLGGAPAQLALNTAPDKPKKKTAARRAWTAGAEVVVAQKSGRRRAVVADARPDGVCHVVLRAEGTRKADVSPRSWAAQELTEDPQADGKGVAEALAVLQSLERPPQGWIEQLEQRAAS